MQSLVPLGIWESGFKLGLADRMPSGMAPYRSAAARTDSAAVVVTSVPLQAGCDCCCCRTDRREDPAASGRGEAEVMAFVRLQQAEWLWVTWLLRNGPGGGAGLHGAGPACGCCTEHAQVGAACARRTAGKAAWHTACMAQPVLLHQLKSTGTTEAASCLLFLPCAVQLPPSPLEAHTSMGASFASERERL
jgi:hypothetical protein